MQYDFCIIGGGIVGLATARAVLRERPSASLMVIEKEATLGRHQTGHNSGVIHTGIYYQPGSLKARLCREGAARTKEFCAEHGIPFEARGKLIVATHDGELGRLQALFERSKENGIRSALLSADAIKEREPSVFGLQGIDVPDAAIVDYSAILRALAAEIEGQGATVLYSATPSRIEETGAGVEIDCDNEVIRADRLIACAGLQSDRVAALAGVKIQHRIVPFRGEYWRLAPRLNSVVNAMIYPVPDPDLPFLGVHLTPMIDGSVTVGPNAMLGLAREGYRKLSMDLKDVADMALFPGFWRSMAANIGPGLTELGNSLFKRRYLAACQRYCPQLELSDLTPMEAGIRAQAVTSKGEMLQDFLFLQTDRMLHVCNAPSPAATSALPIGDMIAARVLGQG